MDVKGRARARAADLRDKAGAMTVQLRSSAAQAGSHRPVHDRATHAGHKVQDKAVKSGHKVQDKAVESGHKVQDRTLQAVTSPRARLRRRVPRWSGGGRERSVPQPARPLVLAAVRHPRPALIVGAALAAVVVVSWRYPKK